jgi:hypothetical protein
MLNSDQTKIVRFVTAKSICKCKRQFSKVSFDITISCTMNTNNTLKYSLWWITIWDIDQIVFGKSTINAITKEAWSTAQNTEDKGEKIHALSLTKECYSEA